MKDYWFYGLLKAANIDFEPQGSTIKVLYESLESELKRIIENVGFPEFIGILWYHYFRKR